MNGLEKLDLSGNPCSGIVRVRPTCLSNFLRSTSQPGFDQVLPWRPNRYIYSQIINNYFKFLIFTAFVNWLVHERMSENARLHCMLYGRIGTKRVWTFLRTIFLDLKIIYTIYYSKINYLLPIFYGRFDFYFKNSRLLIDCCLSSAPVVTVQVS